MVGIFPTTVASLIRGRISVRLAQGLITAVTGHTKHILRIVVQQCLRVDNAVAIVEPSAINTAQQMGIFIIMKP